MNFDLYVITDEEVSGGLSHVEIARRAISGGADVIQLRDKTCSGERLVTIGREIRKITRGTKTLFMVNDRLDVALACGADGVHLGQDDLCADAARQLAPEGFIIGVSVGSVDEAIQAQDRGADYIAVSPLFSTGSKRDAGPALGLAVLRAIRSQVSIPVIVVGGIGSHNVREVITAGADGVAVISAVVGSRDIAAAVTELKALITKSKKSRDS